MEEQTNHLVEKAIGKYKVLSPSRRLLIAISGIPGSGKTTLASVVVRRLNEILSPKTSNTSVAIAVSMDGYHLSRAQLSAMPDPSTAHARRGAAFTFDAHAFLDLVKTLRAPLLSDSTNPTVYAPSFDHAVKDPVVDDVPIAPSARVVVFEGNYLSLDREPWNQAAELMDELWFVDVDTEVARQRLVVRHVQAGLAADEEEAGQRADQNDLVNGMEILANRLDVQELVTSRADDTWSSGANMGCMQGRQA